MTGFGTRVSSIRSMFMKRISPWTEYRGTSFAIGGDPRVVTLNNLFKKYSPGIQGESKGDHPWQVRNSFWS